MANVHSVQSVRAILRSGFGYSVTSALAILAGYLINADFPIGADFLLLAIPWSFTFFFFIAYSNSFKFYLPDGDTAVQNERAVWLALVAAILLSLALGTFYYTMNDNSISLAKVIFLLFYALICTAYGFFIYLRKPTASVLPQIRHQLIWPTILTIGLGLYCGIMLNPLSSSLLPAIPMILLVIWFLILQKYPISKKYFAIVNGIIVLMAIAKVYFSKLGIFILPYNFDQLLSSLLFCLVASSFLAVFEAWRITSDVAKGILGLTIKEQEEKSRRYYIATLVAFILSALSLPLIYVFSSNGPLFLLGFWIVSLFAFLLWTAKGNSFTSLKQVNWIGWKNLFGFLLLVLLVIDSQIGYQQKKQVFSAFMSFTGWAILLALSCAPIHKLAMIIRTFGESNSDVTTPNIIDFMMDRKNVLLTVLPLALFMSFLLLIFKYSELMDEKMNCRANGSYIAYVLYILLIMIMNWGEIVGALLSALRKAGILSIIWGIIKSLRIHTSVLIGIIIIIPALHQHNGVFASSLLALPIMLAAMGGFVLNDVFDAERDYINKPRRAIPGGEVPKTAMVLMAFLILSCATAISFWQAESLYELLIYAVAIIGVVLYNYIVKYVGIIKSAFAAMLCCAPFIYIIAKFDYSAVYYLMPIAAFLYIMGRELLMDIADILGDMRTGIRTLPMLIGAKRTMILAFLMQLAGFIVTLPAAEKTDDVKSGIWLVLMLVGILGAQILWLYRDGKYRKVAIALFWIPMLLGIRIVL